MKIKYFLLGGIAAFILMHSAPDLLADAPLRSVVVTHTDGTSLSVSLSGSLTLSFSEDALLMTDAASALYVSVPRERLASFSLSAEEASVRSIAADDGVPAPVVTDAGVTLGSLPEGTAVRGFSPAGALLFERRVSGDCFLARSLFAVGVNVLKINGNGYKIILR